MIRFSNTIGTVFRRLSLPLVLWAWLPFAVCAQQAEPPFAYPVAPDTCTTLESRCQYIITRFWDNYDITRPIRDEQSYERAFRDYVDFFRYAHRNVALAAARDFMFRARANAKNLEVVGRVAEAALYGPEAEYWSDEVYLEFIRPLSISKALPKAQRERYKAQVAAIEACQQGQTLDIPLQLADGKKCSLSDIAAKGYMLVLADASTDSRIACTRLSADATLNRMIDNAQVTLVLLRLDKPAAGWALEQPANWVCATCPDSRHIDVRVLPCCYLLDADRKILNKNVGIDALKDAIAP